MSTVYPPSREWSTSCHAEYSSKTSIWRGMVKRQMIYQEPSRCGQLWYHWSVPNSRSSLSLQVTKHIRRVLQANIHEMRTYRSHHTLLSTHRLLYLHGGLSCKAGRMLIKYTEHRTKRRWQAYSIHLWSQEAQNFGKACPSWICNVSHNELWCSLGSIKMYLHRPLEWHLPGSWLQRPEKIGRERLGL